MNKGPDFVFDQRPEKRPNSGEQGTTDPYRVPSSLPNLRTFGLEEDPWHDLRREKAHAIANAAMALTAIAEIDQTRAHELITYADECPDFLLQRSLAHLLDGAGSDIKPLIKRATAKLADFDQWLAGSKELSSLLEAIEDKLDYDAVKEALSALVEESPAPDAQGPEDSGDYDIPGFHELANVLADTPNFLENFPEGTATAAHALITQIRELHQKGGPSLAKRYVDDAVIEILHIRPLINNIANMRQQVEQLPEAEHKLAVRRLALQWFTNDLCKYNGDGLSDIAPIVDLLNSYLRVVALKASLLLTEIDVEGDSPSDFWAQTADALESLKSQGIRTKDIVPLIVASEEGQRLELLQLLVEDPTLTTLWQEVRRTGLSPSSFADFVLNRSSLMLSESDSPQVVSEALSNLGEKPYHRNNKAYLCDEGFALLFSGIGPTALQIARNYVEAPTLLREYQLYVHSGEKAKAAFLIYFGQHAAQQKAPPDTAQLKRIRDALATLDNAQVANVIRLAGSGEQLVNTLLRLASKASGTATALDIGKRADSQKSNWKELMWDDLERRGTNFSQLERTGNALDFLGQQGALRLRSVWRKQPEQLSSFVDHVLQYHETEMWSVLASDSILFNQYRRRLSTAPSELAKILESVATCEEGSARLELMRHFIPERKEFELQEVKDLDEQSQYSRDGIKFKRIIVWGGRYKGDKRAKLEDAVPSDIDLRVFDLFTRASRVGDLGPTDLIIWITSSNTHSGVEGEDAVKRKAIKAGAEFCYFTKSGIQPLLDRIREITQPT